MSIDLHIEIVDGIIYLADQYRVCQNVFFGSTIKW